MTVPTLLSSLLSWLAALAIGFGVAILTLGAELLFTVTGQIIGLVPIASAQALIGQSLTFLVFIAILEESVKYLAVRMSPLIAGRITALCAGLGFAAVEPFLFWLFQPDAFALSYTSLLPNILLHTALFSLYASAARHNITLSRFALVFGSLLHIGANLLSAQDVSSAPTIISTIAGFLLIVTLFLPLSTRATVLAHS